MFVFVSVPISLSVNINYLLAEMPLMSSKKNKGFICWFRVETSKFVLLKAISHTTGQFLSSFD